jgi:hypothetical protein
MADESTSIEPSKRFGLAALTLVAAEIVVIAGGCGAIRVLGLWGRAPAWVEVLFKVAYLVGVGALVLAIVGLAKDEDKAFAALALVLGLIGLASFGLIFTV